MKFLKLKHIMKKLKKMTLGLIALLIAYIAICLVIYRVTSGHEEVIVDKVKYKMAELNFTNRNLFEIAIMQNEVIRLENGAMFYISKEERKKLWPESPFDMSKKGYTLEAKLKVKQLLFGGHSQATLVSVSKVNAKPMIRK